VSQKRNIHTLYVEAMLWGLYNGIPGAFLSVFALRLGASNQAIGWLTALPSLVNVLWLIPSARLIERQRHVLKPLLLSALLQGVQIALIALIPFFPGPYQTPLLLLIVGLGAMPSGLYPVVINTVLAEVVPPAQRVGILSNRSLLLSLSDAVAVFAGGWFLGLLPLPGNYQALFLIVAALTLVNIYNLRRMEVPGAPTSTVPGAALSLARLRQLAATGGEARPFLRFLLAIFIVLFGGWLPRPLFSVYWVRYLHASDLWVGIVAGAYDVAAIIGYPIWGRIAGDWSSRRLLLVGTLGFLAYPTLTVLASAPPHLLAACIVGGLMSPPYNLGLVNGLLDFAPQQHRPTYMAMYSVATSLASFLGPIVGASLILPLAGIQAAIMVGTAARFLGFVAVYFLVRK
jgi:MFS family permease